MTTELLTDPGHIRQDLQIIKKAIDQRWPTTPEYRLTIIRRLMLIVASKSSSDRNVIGAAQVLLKAEQQNIADEQHNDNRVDAGRNRILDLLGRSGPIESPRVIESRGKGFAVESGDEPPP